MKSEPLPPDLALAIDAARPRLGRLRGPIVFLSSTSSTNDIAAALPEGAVVIADEQTAGRGRRGHDWFSPPASGLYISVVLCPASSPLEAPTGARSSSGKATMLLPLSVGVALAEAIEASERLRVDLKWPNDLMVGRRKLGGILAESQYGEDGRVVVGYGINIAPSAFPLALKDKATSLESELGRPIDRPRLIVETLSRIASRFEDLLDHRFDAILDAWRARAPGSRGASVSLSGPNGPLSGRTAGIDGDGALLVRTGDRVERVLAGEVTWL